MKKFLALFITLVLVSSMFAASVAPPSGWLRPLWDSTLALYGTKGATTQFLCTAEPIAKIPGGYRLLSAGHCVQLVPPGVEFSVADEIGGPRTSVTMVKAVLDGAIDLAIFDLQTTKKYTLFPLGNESELKIGDSTVNPHFAQGITKQLSFGTVASVVIGGSSEACPKGDCAGNFIVQEYAGAGASGSAVLSVKSHKVVGILVWEFDRDYIGFGVEPISMYAQFLAAPVQPHPGVKTADQIIPPDVFAAQFGPAHPFMLTSHGPNPVFVQNGYKFQAATDGFELSEEYYYNIPVYIGIDDDGDYRLTSTRDDVSVGVDVLGKS